MGSEQPFLQPLSARSVVLSLLLGTQPPRMSARRLTELGEHFGIAAPTTRVALSRMTAAGDLVQTELGYELAERHLERQHAIDAALSVSTRPHNGRWRMAVITSRGRPVTQRAELRKVLQAKRFAELREGVWLRPDNLAERAMRVGDEVRMFLTTPEDEEQLCNELWDLEGWATQARQILQVMGSGASPMRRLTAAAAAVRLLRTDPVLPQEISPAGWPADELHTRYGDYRKEFSPASLEVST